MATLETLFDKNERKFKIAAIVAAIIFVSGWSLAWLVVGYQGLILNTLGELVFLLAAGLLLCQALSVAAATWFYLQKERYSCDIVSKKTGKNVLIKANFLLLLLACVCIYLFIFVAENYANTIRDFMPFDNGTAKNLATAFSFCLFGLAGGFLSLSASIRLCLATYTSTYEVFDNQDKRSICYKIFMRQWIYAGLLFLLLILTGFNFIDLYFLQDISYRADIYVVFTFLVICFYIFCNLVGTGLLFWDMKKRRYDGF